MKHDLEPRIRAQRQGDFTNNSTKRLKPPSLELIAWVVDTFPFCCHVDSTLLRGRSYDVGMKMRHDDITNCSPNVCDNCFVEKKENVLENNSSKHTTTTHS
jgi:hypothetical protein